MTQTQRIIASALNRPDITSGTRVYVKEAHPAISTVAFCGAYGRLYLKDSTFTVPEGVFINLDGALRNDATSDEVAEYVAKFLSDEELCNISVEFGGDAMGYLTMDDRISVTKKLCESGLPFSVIFECDYITAEYVSEALGEKPVAFYNDGPQSFKKVITLDLGKI